MELIKEIFNEIKKHEKIIILRHKLPDGDAYGFQFGLKRIINLNWPDKIVKISGLPNPRLDYVGTEFDEIKDSEFAESLVIVGDTANTARIDDERWSLGKKVIKIDHHPNREPFGDLIYVRDDFCAASEILADMIRSENLKIDAEAAKIIFHGIVTDSGRFLVRFPKPRTFELAGWLLQQGFNLEALYHDLYERPIEEVRFTSYVYDNFKTSPNGVAHIYLPKEKLKEFNLSAFRAAYDYSTLLADIQNVPVWVIFAQLEDGTIRAELRSSGVTINHVAEQNGGGGHKTSCGIQFKDLTMMDVVIDQLDQTLAKEKNGN
ncbi:bifunctional oligoribonuclease and PAP phosphatase NrnA [Williamsoniiplasma luminosum]|uniref:Bifunctional oligoribonuclease and PAP phosphatase NrnA n=1 Tax=Williamsoniiplasma luminosum TaxID=214888 RepID=A0A2K8NUF6_9MOLU|nr:bifunctional oligoribonuclease/PAP phosphatase NrnA [Williamsoniiplasma luminosum]ATZ17397.1 bifunctional oligoribonuclease and PAP phosphatase NrnA [Williamsoniiplasma luminosum]